LNTYGTLDSPFPELPPAASFYSVSWSSVKAVKWQYLSMLTDAGSTVISDSHKGTLSTWIKFDDTENNLIFFYGGQSYVWLTMQAGGWLDSSPTSGAVVTSMRLWLRALDPEAPEDPVPLMVIEDQANISDINKWYHIYIEWDTDAGTAVIKINNATVTPYIFPGDDYLTASFRGPPFTIPWGSGKTNDALDWPSGGSEVHFLDRYYTPSGNYSIADFWLDVGRTGVGVDKFLASSTNPETGVSTYTPKGLGTNGELSTGPAPKFFFARRGTPDTFDTNRGTAGEFTLIGDAPLSESSAPKFTIP